VLSRRLSGPAASAPGWLGRDASAAAAQVGAVAALAENAVGALLTAMRRLGEHADQVHVARLRVAALRREQDDDHGSASARLRLLGEHDLVRTTEMPEAVAVVDEWRASEESRRRRHEAWLEEIADDAAATARVLAECCAVVGGRGAPGDSERVTAYLAVRLPGWGDVELAARGRALAGDLMGRTTVPEVRAVMAEAIPLAHAPAFAAALLTGLGVDGVTALLRNLGENTFGRSSPVARVLAAALGAADPSEGRGEIDAVLTAPYVRPGRDAGLSDVLAAGMAALLVAAVPGTPGGLRLDTVVEWGRQLLRRERALGSFAGAGAVPAAWGATTADPAALVIDILASSGEPTAAATLLSDRGTWDVLMARWWGGAGALGELVALAGAGAGSDGRTAMRAGLEALGAGLDDGGDPDGWTVDRRTAAALSRPMAAGLAAHPTVLADLLEAGAEGRPSRPEADGLRGLGYLTIDRTAAGIVDRALLERTSTQLLAVDPSSRSLPMQAVALPAAYLAVQEYGQRLAHTLLAFERASQAELKQFLWKFSPLHLATYASGPIGLGAGVVEPFIARWLGVDGTWEIGPDHGLTFDSEDAARAALTRALESGPDPSLVAVARGARDAFDRAARALGPLDPPEEPVTHWWDPVLAAAESIALERAAAAGERWRPKSK
jgi:hypothetical protein